MNLTNQNFIKREKLVISSILKLEKLRFEKLVFVNKGCN